jgi:MFS family permease
VLPSHWAFVWHFVELRVNLNKFKILNKIKIYPLTCPVVNAFSVGIFRNMGFTGLQAALANVGVMVMGLIFGLLSALLVDRLGRRPMMLASFLAMITTNALIAALMHAYSHYKQAILKLIFFDL